jgi:CysZ protein
MKLVRRFFLGFGFVFTGWNYLGKVPGLKKWIVMPILIDLVLLVFGLKFGTSAIHALVLHFQTAIFGANPAGWAASLSWVVLIIFWLLFFIFYLYLVYILASIIGAPFYSIIAARVLGHVEKSRGTFKPKPMSLLRSIHMIWMTLLRSLMLTVVAAILFVVSFIPGLNLVAAFLTFVLIGFDLTDYALELKGYHLRQRFRFLFRNFAEYCGMGAFIGLTAFVPGLILLLVPTAVIGGTVLVDTIILNETGKPEAPT